MDDPLSLADKFNIFGPNIFSITIFGRNIHIFCRNIHNHNLLKKNSQSFAEIFTYFFTIYSTFIEASLFSFGLKDFHDMNFKSQTELLPPYEMEWIRIRISHFRANLNIMHLGHFGGLDWCWGFGSRIIQKPFMLFPSLQASNQWHSALLLISHSSSVNKPNQTLIIISIQIVTEHTERSLKWEP